MAQYQITEIFELLHHLFQKNTKDLRDGTALGIDCNPNPFKLKRLKHWKLTTTNEPILGKGIGMGPILILLSPGWGVSPYGCLASGTVSSPPKGLLASNGVSKPSSSR